MSSKTESDEHESDTNDADEQADNPPYNVLEGAIETTQEAFEPVEDALNDTAFEADAEDFEEKLESIEDTADDAQDEADVDELAAAPAKVDYLQALVENLGAQSDAITDDHVDVVKDALEGVEEALDEVPVMRSVYFARVGGVPLLYNEATVKAERLIADGRNPDDPSNYVLKGWATSLHQSLQGEWDSNKKVPLDDLDEFTTERDKGGGQV